MNNNEIIRINIEIDNRDIRNLDNVIRDLNITLQVLNGTIDNAVGNIESMVGSLQPANSNMGEFRSSINDAMLAMGILNVSTQHFEKNLGATGKELLSAKGALGALEFLGKGALFAGAIWGAQQLFSWLGNVIDSTDTTRDRINRLNDTLEENRQAHRNAIDEINANERSSGALVTTLLRLNNGTGDLNDERDETIRLARILNAAENDLNLTYDEQTGFLNESSVATLEQERDRIAMNATLERSTQHFESLEEALKAEYEANHENSAELERLSAQRERLNERVERGNELGWHCHEVQNAVLRELSRTDAKYEELQDTLAGFNDEVEYHYNNWIEHQTEFEQQRAALIAEHGLSYEVLSDQQRDVVHRMAGYWEMYADMGSEMFRKLADDSEVYLGDIIENQDHNYEATKAWQDNLALLTARYGEEVAQYFRDMGESGMTTVAAMAEDVTSSYGEMETWTSETLETMAEESGSSATQIVENLERGGELGGRGLALRLGEGADDVLEIVRDLANETPETLKAGFDAADFPGMGARSIEEVAEGMLRAGPTVERAAIKSGEYVVDGIDFTMNGAVPRLRKSGENVGDSILGGIDSTLSQNSNLLNTTRETMSAVSDEAKSTFGINSPSRLFMGYGENIIQGLTLGLKVLQAKPTTQLQKTAQNMQAAMNSQNSAYQNIGQNIMTGLNQGLLNNERTLMATANRIASNIARTMRDALDINSPSRLMRDEVGRHIPSGVAAGVEKYSDVALDSVHNLGKEMIKINIPDINDIISLGPSMHLTGAGGSSVTHVTNDQRVDYSGLFDGATFNWSGEPDVRRLMEKIAWITKQEQARMWR